MLIGLKVDVFSLFGAQEILPSLLGLLENYRVKASFFCALGPDPAEARRRLRLSRPRLIGERAVQVLRQVWVQGHELGAVPYDLARWRRHILTRDATWTRAQLQEGIKAFRSVFGQPPRAVAAPDFAINADVPRIEEGLGLDYAVDTRGLSPYLPVTAAGRSLCPQLPVTLPRIEDALDQGEPLNDVHQYLFMETQRPILPGHLFSFTAAEPSHLPVLERLLVMWMGSQREPGTVRRLLEQVDRGALPFHEVLLRQEDGHRAFAVQGAPVADP